MVLSRWVIKNTVRPLAHFCRLEETLAFGVVVEGQLVGLVPESATGILKEWWRGNGDALPFVPPTGLTPAHPDPGCCSPGGKSIMKSWAQAIFAASTNQGWVQRRGLVRGNVSAEWCPQTGQAVLGHECPNLSPQGVKSSTLLTSVVIDQDDGLIPLRTDGAAASSGYFLPEPLWPTTPIKAPAGKVEGLTVWTSCQGTGRRPKIGKDNIFRRVKRDRQFPGRGNLVGVVFVGLLGHGQ